ncbi:MAG: poly(3-hydroxyalkanoate) depolymerase [Kiritimatiellae bacterium]|nr:poly(3-hydroxyalkanoate) depolymerase [Kiritimatiellia bacterium]DAC82031.1 TPA_exp: ketosynthase [Kiritimatiellota bacterium]
MYSNVVITGIGISTSIGRGIEQFTDALQKGVSGITRDDEDGLGIAGRIQSFDYEDRLAGLNLPDAILLRSRKAGRRAPRSAQVSIITALEAWMQAFSGKEGYPSEEIDVIVAGHNIGQQYQYRMAEKFKEHPEYIPANYALHFMDTDHVGILSETLGIQGEGFTVGGASASGNVGIFQAYRHIKYGLCKACVVVGAMADLSPVELQAFRQTGALGGKRFAAEPEKACRPFDADREGFIYGQGSACLILESAKSAQERGIDVWGEIAGGAVCLDGNRLSNPSVSGEARAMKKALEEAGSRPENVEYVNAHATSSVIGDEVEVQALKEIFGSHAANVWVNATKSLTGHCLYAAGVVEAVATLIQMKNGFLHPNLNLKKTIDDECRFAGLTSRAEICHLVLTNAFGFGGINTSIVIKKF